MNAAISFISKERPSKSLLKSPNANKDYLMWTLIWQKNYKKNFSI